MRIRSTGSELWLSVWIFLTEPSLLAYVVSTFSIWADSNDSHLSTQERNPIIQLAPVRVVFLLDKVQGQKKHSFSIIQVYMKWRCLYILALKYNATDCQLMLVYGQTTDDGTNERNALARAFHQILDRSLSI